MNRGGAGAGNTAPAEPMSGQPMPGMPGPGQQFVMSFNFRCQQCGNTHPPDFYLMPSEGVRPNNTFGFIDNVFRLVCKRCREEYRIELKIERFVNAER